MNYLLSQVLVHLFLSHHDSEEAEQFRLSRAPLNHDRNGKVGASAPSGF